jgi:8-oxo-dGTP pyrophosphatase MutT (NUDIX family)
MTHLHEKIDFTASVYIVHDRKVLLRKHEKYGLWLPPGGHIELDEDPNEAAVREAKEEVGLDVVLWEGNKKFHSVEKNPFGFQQDLIPPVALNRHDLPNRHEHIDFTYIASAQTDKVTPESADDEWLWLSRDELEQGFAESVELMPHVKFYALYALQVLSETS